MSPKALACIDFFCLQVKTYHGSNSFQSHHTVDVLCPEEQIYRDAQRLDHLVRDPVAHARGLAVKAQVDGDSFQVLGRQPLLAHELVAHRQRVRLVQEHVWDVVLDLPGNPGHIGLGAVGAKEGEGADVVGLLQGSRSLLANADRGGGGDDLARAGQRGERRCGEEASIVGVGEGSEL